MREQDRGKIKTPFMLAFSVGAVLFSAHAGGGKAIDIPNNCFNLCFLYKPWY